MAMRPPLAGRRKKPFVRRTWIARRFGRRRQRIAIALRDDLSRIWQQYLMWAPHRVSRTLVPFHGDFRSTGRIVQERASRALEILVEKRPRDLIAQFEVG